MLKEGKKETKTLLSEADNISRILDGQLTDYRNTLNTKQMELRKILEQLNKTEESIIKLVGNLKKSYDEVKSKKELLTRLLSE